MCLKATRAQIYTGKARTGTYALWSLLVFLFASCMGAAFGPPPPDTKILALTALAIWLTIPWAAWADRHRTLT